MQEIKAIANLTALNQPQTAGLPAAPNSFIDLFQELLNVVSDLGDQAEVGNTPIELSPESPPADCDNTSTVEVPKDIPLDGKIVPDTPEIEIGEVPLLPSESVPHPQSVTKSAGGKSDPPRRERHESTDEVTTNIVLDPSLSVQLTPLHSQNRLPIVCEDAETSVPIAAASNAVPQETAGTDTPGLEKFIPRQEPIAIVTQAPAFPVEPAVAEVSLTQSAPPVAAEKKPRTIPTSDFVRSRIQRGSAELLQELLGIGVVKTIPVAKNVSQTTSEVRLEPQPVHSALFAAAPVLVPEGDQEFPQVLNLDEFGVTRFEYKTEIETPLQTMIQTALVIQMVRPGISVRETKSVRLIGDDSEPPTHDANLQAQLPDRPAIIAGPEAVEHVRLVFEPPPPPPVVRSVSMDIGEAESQVRVVIRERNGSLNVQFGSANERLRQDLQTSGPLLMRELQRNDPQSVTLDFSNFGSATDSESHSRSQSQTKKYLKPEEEFADVVESTYLSTPSSTLKPL